MPGPRRSPAPAPGDDRRRLGHRHSGTRLVPRLADQGLAVRLLTRDPARAQHLTGRGVEVVRGDVRAPGSLTSALRGASTVVSAVHGFAGPAWCLPGIGGPGLGMPI